MLLYFWLLLKGSLVSTSGTGNFPILHDDFLPRGWATDRQFAESLAVGQVSPGPSGLWVISLGYLTAGLRGALLAVLAIALPPLLIVAIDRLYRRVQHHPGVEGFVRGLGLSVVGIFGVVMLRLLHANGVNVRSGVIVLASVWLSATRRLPVVAILALGALAGLVWR